MSRKGILFCMRYPDDQGFVWRTVVRVRDRIAGLLTDYRSYVAFPQLTGHSVHKIEHMQPVELDCYNLTAANKERLAQFVAANDIGAIVYMSALPTSLDMAFLHSLGLKTINTEQDSFDHRVRDSLPRQLAKFVVRRIMKRQLHDLHIANSASQGEWLKSYTKIPPERLVIVPNGIDTDHFVPPADPRDDSVVDVICAGQARREKRIELILRCAKRIVAQPEFASVRFTYVGDGEMRPVWERLAADMDLAGRFRFVGARADLLPFFQSADLMVHAAERESFGLVLAEAMACEVPVVACAAAGPSEIVADGTTGRLVALDDEDGFAAAVETYLRKPALRAVHGAAGRARVVGRFSMERQVRDMAAAIAGALA
ncbi:glycosyltransferase family 1 protein [Aurantiacibacter xanthus]|uniref:Glycosyltransferase family 1 protein n=1 Tax=Aurantiacibacter xanthus TaxID=1784712 RepID=A0A3A1P500_9SPHN|nr:glycosyltransferase family 4 protein [Aurantiacibacter xanthus]RIV88359.1 glycosyltransferase family 1 protein [Aurantiacibacter xanthus]